MSVFYIKKPDYKTGKLKTILKTKSIEKFNQIMLRPPRWYGDWKIDIKRNSIDSKDFSQTVTLTFLH